MEELQSLPDRAASSTAYSSGGVNHPHFVDDFSVPQAASQTSSELQSTARQIVKELERPEKREREGSSSLTVISLEDLSNDNEGEEEDPEETPIAHFMRLIKNAIMNSSTPPVLDTAPSSPSSSASSATMNHEPAILVWHNNKLIYADMGTDNGTESSKDKNPEATKRLQALLAQSHLQHDKPAQKPLNASELGIMSSFKARGSQFFHSRKDAKATDHRIWTEGFDATIFSQSARLQEGEDVTPIVVKFTLSGTEQRYMEFYEEAAIYERNRSAFRQILEIVNPILENRAAPAELSRIANQFFNGKPLDEDFEEYNRTASHSGDDCRDGYTIEYPLSPWIEFVFEVFAGAEAESIAENSEVLIFRNTAHKNFGMFIQDVIMSNEMKAAMTSKDSWDSMEIFPSEAQAKAQEILARGKPISNEDIQLIARVRAADDKDKFKVQHSFDDDNTDDEAAEMKMIASSEDANANAMAAAAQLLAEQDAELSKDHPEKKPRSRKRKPKAKKTAPNPILQEKPSEDAEETVEPKNEKSGLDKSVMPSADTTGKKPEASAVNQAETRPQPSDTSNKKMKGQAKAKTTNKSTTSTKPVVSSAESSASTTKKSTTASSKPVVTLADYEDATMNAESSVNDDEGWQTVGKPSRSKPAAVRASSGAVQGAHYGLQGVDTSNSPVQQNNRDQGSMNGPARPANAPNTFRPIARDASSSAQQKVVPAASTANVASKVASSKAVAQTHAVDQPRPYENEYPAMPEKTPKPAATAQVLKITPVVPKVLAKTPVVAKGQTAKPEAENATVDEKPIHRDSSDLDPAKITRVSENAEGKQTSKIGTDMTSAARDTTKKVPKFASKLGADQNLNKIVINVSETAEEKLISKGGSDVTSASKEVTKKVSAKANQGEKSAREGSSDSKSASKQVTKTPENDKSKPMAKEESNMTITANRGSKAEGKSIPKSRSGPNLASKKISRERSLDIQKGEQEDPADTSLQLPEKVTSTQIVDAKDSSNREREAKHAAISSITEHDQVPSTTYVSQDATASTDASATEQEEPSQLQESFIGGQSSEDPSHLEENYPVTPQCPTSARPLHVMNDTETPINLEAQDTLSKQLDGPLSWMTGDFTGPADFLGRPRRKSLPSDSSRSQGFFGEMPPLIRRARGLSLAFGTLEENEEGDEQCTSTESPSPTADQPSTDVDTPKKETVVTAHPERTFTAATPMPDTTFHAHPSMNEGHSATSSQQPGVDRYGYSLQIGPDGYPVNHYLARGNLAPSSHGWLPGFTPTVSNTSYGYAATSYSAGGLAPSAQMTSNNGDGHGTNPASKTGPQETYSCTHCNVRITATTQTPLVFCSGCGPTPGCTYCSVACLLVDSYHHSVFCWNFPASAREYPHVFPPGAPYVYEPNPVMSEDPRSVTPEMFRQRTFLLYARYGPWPNLAEAWCRKNVQWPISTPTQPISLAEHNQWRETLIDFETQKRTGIYHIFWSGAFESSGRANPRADVLYTISINQQNPQKGFLSRVIHALMIRDEGNRKPLATFAFRMIRNVLTTPALYNEFGSWEDAGLVLLEFERQFELEFRFNRQMDMNPNMPFNFKRESKIILPFLISIESSFQVLRRWATD